jgi:NADH-quinone oxidoreductase subunit G
LNAEPVFDSAAGQKSVEALNAAEMVVTLSPFKANLEFSDVLLPIAPFTETSGSFVNAEGRIQSFHAVVKPLAETRPAWKVIRVLANLLSLPGFDFESSQAVLETLEVAKSEDSIFVPASRLANTTNAAIDLAPARVDPASASIYQLDGMVRRSGSLQLTADARRAPELVTEGGLA